MSHARNTAVAAAVVALVLTACEPADTSKDESSDQPTTSSTSRNSTQPASPKTDTTQTGEPTETGAPNEKNGSEYGGYDTEGDVDNSAYDYVCSQVTASEASSTLGEEFTAVPENADMPLPKGMAHCTYRISETKWFTIDYLGDAGWTNHKRLADNNESGYSNQPDGSILIKGPLGTGYVMRDDNNMMIVVQEMGVSKLVGLDKFSVFAKTLPNQIN
jgi:hypothetical protein